VTDNFKSLFCFAASWNFHTQTTCLSKGHQLRKRALTELFNQSLEAKKVNGVTLYIYSSFTFRDGDAISLSYKLNGKRCIWWLSWKFILMFYFFGSRCCLHALNIVSNLIQFILGFALRILCCKPQKYTKFMSQRKLGLEVVLSNLGVYLLISVKAKKWAAKCGN
jgi:hypothetical protein